MKTIELTRGFVTKVDDADFESLACHEWMASRSRTGSWYAARRNPETGSHIKMHRALCGFPRGMDIDHIDGDGLNNQRANLRICTRKQNLANGSRHRDGSSRFKGVSYFKRKRAWQARICSKHLGYFKDEVAAARAYDAAAVVAFGEFARLNFPLVKETA